jgi:type 2A phosphatase activator TIP41
MPLSCPAPCLPFLAWQQRDEFLWYDEVPLFEDELHDNGVSQLSVKVRVMPRFFLALLRFWLRVDQVFLRLVDTRILHFFGSDRVLRQQKTQEASFELLK